MKCMLVEVFLETAYHRNNGLPSRLLRKDVGNPYSIPCECQVPAHHMMIDRLLICTRL